MDNLDDSENNAKISDSAYSNSCSNSQSRRSHSSKSTHSGSNSSGSSGYGGKLSTSGSSNELEQTKKDKDSKKKKKSQSEMKAVEEPVVVECKPPEPIPVPSDTHEEEKNDVVEPPLQPLLALPEKPADSSKDVMTSDHSPNNDEVQNASAQAGTSVSLESSCQVANLDSDGFCCAISMHDGVVMYTTKNLTANLGFPKDMWIGRSFIDFVHPQDRSTFASQIANGLAVPKSGDAAPEKGQPPKITDCSMVCRIRRYRSLEVGYGVKNRTVSYVPFLLKFLFKDIKDDIGKIIYLIIQATPFQSAYKIPNECVVNATPFIIRHSAAGILEHISVESIPYLGYLPQDIRNKEALLLYHPEDLPYLKMIYETIVKEGSVAKSMPYRMLTFNGDYVKLETEWSSFINPWSMKLEFVIGKHYILEGPTIPNVFLSPPVTKSAKASDYPKINNRQAEVYRENILKVLKEVLTKPAEKAKQQMDKRCQDLAMIMESLLEEQPKQEELKIEIPQPEPNCFLRSSVRQERDSVMLGGISPHHDYDSKSSLGTSPSYNQLNYKENLQRFFDSHENYTFEENNGVGENFRRQKTSSCISPSLHRSGDSYDIDSSTSSAAMMFSSYSPPAPQPEVHPPRLTESVLSKSKLNRHNSKMQRELAKIHRESRVKGEKVSYTRQKKKEHLARCNASYQPTTAGASSVQPHGLKRTLKPMAAEKPHKHPRQSRKRQSVSASPTTTSSVAATHTMWPKHTNSTAINSINPYAPCAGVSQQMPMMSHLQGVLPMYYSPTAVPTASHLTSTPSANQHTHQQQQEMMSQHFPQPQMTQIPQPQMTQIPQPQMTQIPQPQMTQIPQPQMTQIPQPQMHQGQLPVQHYPNATMPWMYPQPVYGSPYIYPQMTYPVQQQQAMMAQSMAYNQAPCQSLHPLGLANNNYIQACKSSQQLKLGNPMGQMAWNESKHPKIQMASSSSNMEFSSGGESSSIALNRDSERTLNGDQDIYQHQSTEPVPVEPSRIDRFPMKKPNYGQLGHTSDEAMDRTDGESSYSSFYSSFFKTESGSADDSSDPKKSRNDLITKYWTDKERRDETTFQAAAPNNYTYEPQPPKKTPRRKMDPPWMDQVCVNSDLVYKYQIQPKSKEEALQADKEKFKNLEQPALVNEQLGQLYLDLQLEGVTSRLTLEEGITSSSSSGEETYSTTRKPKFTRRKREYSKLNMIYEEDAPLPPPNDFQHFELEKPEPETISFPLPGVTPISPF